MSALARRPTATQVEAYGTALAARGRTTVRLGGGHQQRVELVEERRVGSLLVAEPDSHLGLGEIASGAHRWRSYRY